MKSVCFLFFVISFFQLIAQNEYVKGYIKMPKKDTIKGEVKLFLKDETNYYAQVMFRPKPVGSAKKFLPNKLSGYGYEDKHFIALKIFDSWAFVLQLVKGKITVYEYKPPVSVGNEDKESIYLVMKGGPDELSELIADAKLKKQLKPLFADDKEFIKELDKQEIDFKTALQLIEKYNSRNP